LVRRILFFTLAIAFFATLYFAQPSFTQDHPRIGLPTSKTLGPVPGAPMRTNGYPATIALSPDGRYAVLLHAGYGAQSSQTHQSLSVLDVTTGQLTDFPDARLAEEARQSYFLGLVFSSDGKRLYASLGSITEPTGAKEGSTGNAIAVYTFNAGKIEPSRTIKIPPQKLAAGKWVSKDLFKTPKGTAIPYPAGLAIVPSKDGDRLLIANNLSDNALLIDVTTGAVLKQFDLSTNQLIPAAYPYAVVVSKDGRRAWCSLWNASRVVELNLDTGNLIRSIPVEQPKSPTDPGSHPTALLLSPDEKQLYVALANPDLVVAVSAAYGQPTRWFSTHAAAQKFFGNTPLALAQSPDGHYLFAADATLDAVAVFDTQSPALEDSAPLEDSLPQAASGFIPTEWYPSALAFHNDELLIATAKGRGTGPNNAMVMTNYGRRHREHPYIPVLLNGSLARIKLADITQHLTDFTAEVETANLLHTEPTPINLPNAAAIKHILYIIKENRTYDQILGDLKVGNGDKSLVMYGADITPNEHKLALQFGVLDNFYDSGEVSGDGHVWSTAAITSDYNEKTWTIGYRGHERTYDFEGAVAGEYPLQRGISDVDSPGTGYLWGNAARHRISLRDYGEFIATEFCEPTRGENPPPKTGTPEPEPTGSCTHKFINKGDPLPANLGNPVGGPSPYPWPIPAIRKGIPTMPELVDHADLDFPAFEVDYPDQLRADEFLSEFKKYVSARKQGYGEELPALMIMHLPNDHTGGTRPGKPTPSASVADNDLALGRIVDAVSHSPYWDDTAIFVLEDDAQDGADHVDAHRSIAFVISKYAPGSAAQPAIDHTFYTTTGMIGTMEALLGLPAMNLNDGYAPRMAWCFSGKGHQPAFEADKRNLDNGLLFKTNPKAAPGARESAKMDFSRPDAVNSQLLNAILWRDRKGKQALPSALRTLQVRSKDSDD
jgi:DNA-binding beta-propeller fold protein YncE